MDACDIVVLGGGVAGCVAARGLAEIGYRVALIAGNRRVAAHEGASERVLAGLRHAGCTRALAAVGPWVPRRALWSGTTAEVNGEHLVDRATFDAALQADAAAAGAVVAAESAVAVTPADGGWQLSVQGAEERTFSCRCVVEARGRHAPRGGRGAVAGPPATALIRRWSVPAAMAPGTVAASFPDGWTWFAVPGDGTATLQIVVAGGRGALPGRKQLESHYHALLGRIPEIGDWLQDAAPAGPVGARNAHTVMAAEPVGDGRIRVGDAALAIDPLSGHGMFEAVATALAAVPTLRTRLERPQDADLAASFYRERIEQAFYRHARVGRDFYAGETRWPEAPFWRDRRAWPDAEPAHPPPIPAAAQVVVRPVIEDGFVVPREVVVTPDYPRGVWQIDGVALAPMLHYLRRRRPATDDLVTDLAAHVGRPAEQVGHALAWLRFRGLLVAAPD